MNLLDKHNSDCDDGKMEFCCHIGKKFDIFKFFTFAVKAKLFGDENEYLSDFAEKPKKWNEEASIWIKAGSPVDESDFRFPIAEDEINVQSGLHRRPSLAMEIGWNLAENIFDGGCDTCMVEFDMIAKNFDFPKEHVDDIMATFNERAEKHARKMKK